MLDYFLTYNDDLWIPTFADAIKYHKERNCATLSTLSNTATLHTLHLTDTLSNNSIYNHPLTIDLQVNANIAIDSITQNGKKITDYILNNTTLTFNAIPDGGNILIYKSLSNAVETIGNKSLISEAYPNPVSDNFTLVFNSNELENVQVAVFNELGQEVYVTSSNINGFSKINIDCSDFANGLYNISVTGNNSSSSMKIMKID